MSACIHCDALATHELITCVPHDGAFDCDTEPLCESCADEYPAEFLWPAVFYRCSICEREIEREHPEPPLCRWCEGTARAAGRQAAEATRHG